MILPDRDAQPGQAPSIASTVSWTGISSSSVTTCTEVIGERSSAATPSLCVLIGPELGQPGRLRGDVEEPPDPAGRRGVEHDRVVHPTARAAVRVVASLTLPVSRTSRRPGAMVVAKSIAPELAQRPAGARPACRTSRGIRAGPPRRRRRAAAPRRRRPRQ